MAEITLSPFFGIVLCIFTFEIGVFINKKANSPLTNPLMIAIIISIAVLKIFNIPLENFDKGGSIITMFLAPATAALSLSIYNQIKLLKKNLLPILIGVGVGSLTSVVSIIYMCKLFGLDEKITASLFPKSVTMPIALELSRQGGGIIPVTVAAVVLTGIAGAMFAPLLIKIFKFNNSIASGVAIGTSSHAAGTSKAVEIGEIEGAMSGIAIGIAGIFTVIYYLIF